VVKHAQAQQVQVRLHLLGNQLELKIRDDGQGTVAASRPGGQGLSNMRMRAQAVGGTVQVDASGPGLGLVVHLPLR
jgi:signal transduction histidine kinase